MILPTQEPTKPPTGKSLAYKLFHTAKILLIVFLAFIAGCGGPSGPDRPRDPWVYRSVLDERPRMITIALHQDMWGAYDTQKCSLYKAWQGGVDFDGAVYTTKHGPQPTSYGSQYLLDPLSGSVWSISTNGTSETIAPEYLGHKFENGQVRLKYQVDYQDQTIAITETPEYIESDGQPGLERSFEVSGLSDNQTLELAVVLNNLPGEFAYQTNGSFSVNNKEEKTYGGLKTLDLNGILSLGNGNTTLESTFAIQTANEKVVETTTSTNDELAQGASLIDNSDCRTCHNETERTVGPSYVEVAEKYPTTDGTIRLLANKIIAGGTGNWGEVPMTAHPDLMEPDAELMVRYILSLDQETEAATEDDAFLGVASIPLNLSEDHPVSESSDIPGLAVNFYLFESEEQIKEIIADGKPILSGTAPSIHITDKAEFGPINENILVDFAGFITVEEDINVDFRLVSDDGSYLMINDQVIIDNGGYHGTEAKDGETILKAGKNDIRIVYFNGAAGGVVSLQWAPYGASEYQVVPSEILTHEGTQIKEAVPNVPRRLLVRSIPGDQNKLSGVHPSFDLSQARPEEFQGRIGGMDFLSDGSLVVCTWDSLGPVYVLKGVQDGNPEDIEVTRIATGLAEPLGLKVVDDEIYVLQKQELTKLIDHDGDGITDEYQTVCDDWKVSANFHEFAFGLEYQDGYFYAALATAINPGGASTQPQIPDRGKAIKISKEDGSIEFIAHGLRTPNGIGIGVDEQLFIADNQGDWLPSSKIVHLQEGAWFGSRSVDFPGTEGLTEALPVVWLPQDEIGNSPSMPIAINTGPYQGQMIHGEVTHGGIKRVFVEKINNQYQGALFRFTQGLEAGVNRLRWGPDGSLYVGCVGSSGNWSDGGQQWYGLQKLTYNDKVTFEMLAVRAKSNGMEIEFTAPIEAGSGHSPEEYQVQQWYYLPTENYGGPKLGLEDLEIASINISDDRKKVFLELPGIKAGHMVYIRLHKPFRSNEQQSLWTTEAWYNLNQIPAGDPGFDNPVSSYPHNTLTQQEQEDGWQLLFDGRTTNGWRNFKSEGVGSAWKVTNGSLMLDNSRKVDGKIVGGGDIITENQYQDFELVLEWKIETGGNSGIMFNVVESDEYNNTYNTGPEMQVLDNVRHPDGRIEKHRAGDLYDMIECEFVTTNGPNEWNKVRLVSKDGKVSQWLNGYEVVSYEMHTPEWDQLIAGSKFKDWPGFGKSKSGHIALQDHQDKVWFRNIKIKEL